MNIQLGSCVVRRYKKYVATLRIIYSARWSHLSNTKDEEPTPLCRQRKTHLLNSGEFGSWQSFKTTGNDWHIDLQRTKKHFSSWNLSLNRQFQNYLRLSSSLCVLSWKPVDWSLQRRITLESILWWQQLIRTSLLVPRNLQWTTKSSEEGDEIPPWDKSIMFCFYCSNIRLFQKITTLRKCENTFSNISYNLHVWRFIRLTGFRIQLTPSNKAPDLAFRFTSKSD